MDLILPPDEGKEQRRTQTQDANLTLPPDNTVASSSVRSVLPTDPDKAGQAKRLSEATGYPMPTVQRNLDEVAREQKLKDIQYQMSVNPILAEQMRDPNFAALAHDDVSSLTELQKQVGVMRPVLGPKPSIASIISGLYNSVGQGFEASRQGLRQQWADFIGSQEMSTDAARKYAGAKLDAALTTPDIKDTTSRAVYGGVQSTLQMLPGLAAAVGTRSMAPVLASAGLQVEGESYGKYRGRGATPTMAGLGALGEGATEVLTEMIPMGFFVSMFGKTGFKQFLGGVLAREVPTELIATHVQDALDTAIANPEKTWSDYGKERLGASYETFVSTLTQSLLLGGAHSAANYAQHREAMPAEVDANMKALQGMFALAAESKVRERSAQSFSQFMASATADAPVNAVYMDPQIFAQGAQQAGIDVAAMPETTKDLQEALATNRDVRIPMNELATSIPGTTFEQAIIPHLRTDPNGPTQAETQDAQWIKDTQAHTEKILAEHEFNTTWKESTATVENELMTQLKEVGRFTPDVNKAYAGFMAAFYATQAHRLGITPEQMYVKYPLQIRASNSTDSSTLHQGREPVVNIGLNVPDAAGGGVITPEQAVAALKAAGVDVTSQDVRQSNTEQTLIAKLSRSLSPEEAHAVSVALKQESIAQIDHQGVGELHGPGAAQWRPFNADYFLTPSGEHASGLLQSQRKSLPVAQEAAVAYMDEAGLPYQPPVLEARVDKERAVKIAQAYDEMKHDPTNPEVAAAYAAMIAETNAQWQVIKATGLKVEFIKDGQADPYAKSPRLAIDDVRENNHLWVFPTDQGFGSDTSVDVSGNPLLAKTGEVIDGREVVANDIFRIVHDYFGHVKDGNGFRANGEENAWRSHAAMYSPLARRAMTSETRGQNSWVNFGPHGETNRIASSAETHYAPQKTGLMPEWTSEEGADDQHTFEQSGRVKNDTPAIRKFLKHLTPAEKLKITDGMAARILEQMKKLPSADEMAAIAHAGSAKRGWYSSSARAISDIFGPDAPRFAMLLAALSPQTSVESNLRNALNVWNGWTKAGRPSDRQALIDIMAANVEGSGSENSVLNAWINNAERALGDEDVSETTLSGPKVQSFYKNLIGELNEITLDTWMANYALVEQTLFSGSSEKTKLMGMKRVKGSGYLAYNARVREAATKLTKYTGEEWTPAEVQETVWSWARTLYTLAEANQSLPTAELKAGTLTGELINSTADFSVLFTEPEYAGILEGAGYGDELNTLRGTRETTGRQPGEDSDTEGKTGPFAAETQRRYELSAARRLDKLKEQRYELAQSARDDELTVITAPDDPDSANWDKGHKFAVYGSLTGLNATFKTEKEAAAYLKQENEFRATLKQSRASQNGARANISFSKNGGPTTMTLLANADLSSFLHESGHFYLEVLADMAHQPNAPQQIVEDFNATMKWFGVTPEQWASFDIEQKRDYHEQWARGFEAYLFEGKSPSTELNGLFSRFRAWMVSVYRQLTELNVTLNPEVRAVMDRLVATNEEIIEAEAARAYAPIFDVKPEGVTDDEWKSYQEQQYDATQEAVDQLQTRSLRDMQWLTNARSRALKNLQKQAAEKRAAVRAEVAAEVDAQPIYIAARGLKNGWLQDDGSKMMLKFNTKALNELYPENMVDRPDLSKLQGMTNAETGLAPDDVASLVGFDSGEALIKQLTTLEPRNHVVEGITDQRMLERYGDLVDPQAIERAADEAVHNDMRARVLATELAMLSKATGNKNLLAKAAKEVAAQIIARQKLKDIKPHLYAAAEARAGKAAEAALKPQAPSGGVKQPDGTMSPHTDPGRTTGDLAAAAAQKRTQVVNMYATKAAYDALAEVQKGMTALRRVLKGTNEDVAKTRDVDVVQAARAVLADYGIGKKGKAAQEYLKAVQAYDPGMYDVLKDRVDAMTQNAKAITDLTLDEFRALRDEIGSMMHLARRSRQMEVDGDLMDRADVQDELYARMEDIGIPDKMPGDEHAVTDGERRLAKFQTARAALRRVESWVGVKDGKELFGPFRKFVWSQIKDAADLYRADKAKHLKGYRAMLEAINDTLKPSRIAAPELGYTFGFSRGGSGTTELLHAILHTGNSSNKKKLLLGRKWATEDAEGNVDTSKWDGFVARMITEGKLTKAHYDFAQSVWNMFEATKPLAQKTHRDVFGYYFNEISAEKFTTPFGDYAGGYVPAIADPEIVTDAKTRALMEEENSSMQFAFPGTNKGFTKSRVEYNRPLLLDLRVMSQHLDKVLLFSHLEQPVRDVRRVLTSKKVAYALNRIDPAAFDGLLTPWLNRTANQQVETPIAGSAGLMRFFSVARSRAGMAAMFANVSNTVQQITGLSTAAVKVHPKYLMSAMADFIAHPHDFNEAVSSSSVYMSGRMENEVGQMTDAINDILLNPSVYEKATAWTAKHSYFLQSAVDNVIGPIVWTGAYNQALETLPVEIKDEQRLKQARRLADGAVRETQGAMQPEEVSRIETGNAFVRLFTQFAGYFNTQANMLGTEFTKLSQDIGLKKGAGRGLYILLFGFLAPAWTAEFIAQAFKGGPDDEDKDGSYLDDWIAAVFGWGTLRYGTAMVPVVGQVANAGMNTLNKKPYDDRISTAPAVSMIESAVAAPKAVYDAVFKDGKPSKAIKDVGALLSLTLGVPASFVARPVSYIADVMAHRVTPTSPADAVRGTVTGTASPASKNH